MGISHYWNDLVVIQCKKVSERLLGLRMKKLNIICFTLIFSLIVLAISIPGFAGDLSTKQKITASDADRDRFGYCVAVSGDYAIVGAFEDDYSGYHSGSAYIFKKQGNRWIEHTKLVPNDIETMDEFGKSVSISGDYAFVNASCRSHTPNSVYIFKRIGDTWVEHSKLTSPDNDPYDRFGYSISASGDYVVIGTLDYENDYSSDIGAAYVFKRIGDTWEKSAILTASDAEWDQGFGAAVSISEDYVIIGAVEDNDKGQYAGAAYIFKKEGNTWIEQAKLTASDAEGLEHFGTALSISQGYAIVGAPKDKHASFNSGSAYVFKQQGNTWVAHQKLVPSDILQVDDFGCAVSMSGNIAVIGAKEGTPFIPPGSAYIYRLDGTTWTEEIKLSEKDGSGNNFGQSVSIDDENVFIGSYDTYCNLDSCDFAYAYTLPDDFSDSGCSGSDCSFPLVKEFQEVQIGTGLTGDHKLIASDKTVGDGFGISVQLVENTPIIWADGNDFWYETTGTAYLFTENGNDWVELGKTKFSGHVDFSGNYAIFGFIKEGYPNTFVYALEWTGEKWVIQAELTASDGGYSDRFGVSVSISGNYAIVGAPNHKVSGRPVGAAYIFKKEGNSWIEQTKLGASDPGHHDYFGKSVSISGDYAIVGAYANDSYGSDSGAAYIFKRNGNTWTEQVKLAPSDMAFSAWFGRSVSISGDYAIVGACNDYENYSYYTGSAYIYKRSGTNWKIQTKLKAIDGEQHDRFGYSVAISDDYALIGTYIDDSKKVDFGSAYLFKYKDNPNASHKGIAKFDGIAEDSTPCGILKEELVGLKGFDKVHYLSAKLSALQTSDPNWHGKSIADLDCFFANIGLTAESHYSYYGYQEGVPPNRYFNHSEYVLAKATKMYNSGEYNSVEEAKVAFKAAWPGDAYLHYIYYGAAEGINPSNSFDESIYLSDKLTALQAQNSDWEGKTIDDLRDLFTSYGMTVIGHYKSYGATEGLSVTSVPSNESVGE